VEQLIFPSFDAKPRKKLRDALYLKEKILYLNKMVHLNALTFRENIRAYTHLSRFPQRAIKLRNSTTISPVGQLISPGFDAMPKKHKKTRILFKRGN
jgi:hypothetical protein